MPFTLRKHKAIKDKKIQIFLIQDLGIDPKVGQRLTSKGRIFDENMNTINSLANQYLKRYILMQGCQIGVFGVKGKMKVTLSV